MASVKERLEKANKKLEVLKAQKKEIYESIKKVESDVSKYQSILDKAKYDELTNVLQFKGLSLEEMVEAVKRGDLLSLQEKLETEPTKEPAFASVGSGVL